MSRRTHATIRRILLCASAAFLASCAIDNAAPAESPDDMSPELTVVQSTLSATAASSCSTRNYFPPTSTPFEGFKFCNTRGLIVPWGTLMEEDFVIGTDCRLYHSWQTTDGVWHPWTSLGGCLVDRFGPVPGNNTTNLGVINFRKSPRSLTVVAIGTDSDYWCRDWPWTRDWYPCLREVDP